MKNLSIEQIIQKLEDNNISAYEYKEGKKQKLCGYELNTYTKGGVNMIVFIDFRDTGMNPKDGRDFIALFNDRISDTDIDKEIELHREMEDYKNAFTIEQSVKDFTEWKERLQNMFSDNPAGQRQYEQTKDKFYSLASRMNDLLHEMMPLKGNSSSECQRTQIQQALNELDHCINGIELEDFTPNEFSQDFKLSYS